MIFAVLLLPMLGAKWSLALVALGYLLLLPKLGPEELTLAGVSAVLPKTHGACPSSESEDPRLISQG